MRLCDDAHRLVQRAREFESWPVLVLGALLVISMLCANLALAMYWILNTNFGGDYWCAAVGV